MERKPPRHSDGPASSRPARGPARPRGDGDSRSPRRGDDNRFRDRNERDSGGPRGGRDFGDRGSRGFGDRGGRDFGDRGDRGGRDFGDRGGRDFGDRPRRPARAEWQNDVARDDRPRADRGGDRYDRPRNDRPRGDRPGERFDRPRNDRPRFDRDDRNGFNDRRPRNDDFRPDIDDDAGNRMDYEPRQAPRFDDRRPRKATFVDRDSAPAGRFERREPARFGDEGPRGRAGGRGDRSPRDRDERRPMADKPRKERYQVWNKELPPADENNRPDRATLKLGAKGDVIERKIYGVNACLAFFAQRPKDIIRAYFTEAVARQYFGELMKFLAQEKLAYHLVPSEDMERVTESTHHEGVCLLVRDQPAESFFHWLETNPTATQEAQCILALEDLGNPHNVGAILRVAAHFGVKAVVVKDASLARSGAAMRTAEGGAEHVKLLEADDFERMLAACRREGYTIVATSSHEGQSLFDQPLPARAVILLGQESKGLSPQLQENSDLRVSIPGTRQVESLNVSVATGILLAEYWRQNGR